MQGQSKVIIFIGRPGSGKGTQAKLLAERLAWPVFSSGGKLKQIIDAGGALSEKLRSDYVLGQLAPDWLVSYFFEETIFGLKEGVVCEGFPRTAAQARLADEILTWFNHPYIAVHLNVSDEEALKRQLSRGQVESRPDSDTTSKVQARFDVYRTSTESVVAFFKEKGNLIEINGEQTPEEIAADIRTALALA